MKISIVIPVYNEENYIKSCLESLVHQEVRADEILIVDNNCTDRSMEIARTYPVRIVKEAKQGMIFARNRGFNEAIGDIMIRIDSDTIMPSYWVKRTKEIFETQKIDGMSGPTYYNDLPLQTPYYSILYLAYLKKKLGHHCFIGSNMALTKAIWNKVKDDICLDDKLVHEDIDLSYHIGHIGGVIHFERSMIMPTSGRRIKHNPTSFFIEYPRRLKSTLNQHKQS